MSAIRLDTEVERERRTHGDIEIEIDMEFEQIDEMGDGRYSIIRSNEF